MTPHHITWQNIMFCNYNHIASPHVTSPHCNHITTSHVAAQPHNGTYHITSLYSTNTTHTTETEPATTKTPTPDGTAEGWCTRTHRFEHGAGWSPCDSFFPFWNFPPPALAGFACQPCWKLSNIYKDRFFLQVFNFPSIVDMLVLQLQKVFLNKI